MIAILVGFMLGTTLPLSLARSFADGEEGSSTQSGLGVKKKYNILAGTLLACVSVMILENATSKLMGK